MERENISMYDKHPTFTFSLHTVLLSYVRPSVSAHHVIFRTTHGIFLIQKVPSACSSHHARPLAILTSLMSSVQEVNFFYSCFLECKFNCHTRKLLSNDSFTTLPLPVHIRPGMCTFLLLSTAMVTFSPYKLQPPFVGELTKTFS